MKGGGGEDGGKKQDMEVNGGKGQGVGARQGDEGRRIGSERESACCSGVRAGRKSLGTENYSGG